MTDVARFSLFGRTGRRRVLPPPYPAPPPPGWGGAGSADGDRSPTDDPLTDPHGFATVSGTPGDPAAPAGDEPVADPSSTGRHATLGTGRHAVIPRGAEPVDHDAPGIAGSAVPAGGRIPVGSGGNWPVDGLLGDSSSGALPAVTGSSGYPGGTAAPGSGSSGEVPLRGGVRRPGTGAPDTAVGVPVGGSGSGAYPARPSSGAPAGSGAFPARPSGGVPTEAAGSGVHPVRPGSGYPVDAAGGGTFPARPSSSFPVDAAGSGDRPPASGADGLPTGAGGRGGGLRSWFGKGAHDSDDAPGGTGLRPGPPAGAAYPPGPAAPGSGVPAQRVFPVNPVAPGWPAPESVDPAEARALAGAFAADYLSWDEDDPGRRGRVLTEHVLEPGGDPARMGWSGRGRQRAEIVLPGRVRPDSDGRLLVDVRVRVTPYRSVGAHASPAEDDTEVPGTPAVAPPPTAKGWRSLPAYWIRITVPVVDDGERLAVDAWEETLGEVPEPTPAPPQGRSHDLADDPFPIAGPDAGAPTANHRTAAASPPVVEQPPGSREATRPTTAGPPTAARSGPARGSTGTARSDADPAARGTAGGRRADADPAAPGTAGGHRADAGQHAPSRAGTGRDSADQSVERPADATRAGLDAARAGIDAARAGIDAARPGGDRFSGEQLREDRLDGDRIGSDRRGGDRHHSDDRELDHLGADQPSGPNDRSPAHAPGRPTEEPPQDAEDGSAPDFDPEESEQAGWGHWHAPFPAAQTDARATGTSRPVTPASTPVHDVVDRNGSGW